MRHRITIELTRKQYLELARIVPHGMKKPLFQALVERIIEAHKKGGVRAITDIIAGHLEVVSNREEDRGERTGNSINVLGRT